MLKDLPGSLSFQRTAAARELVTAAILVIAVYGFLFRIMSMGQVDFHSPIVTFLGDSLLSYFYAYNLIEFSSAHTNPMMGVPFPSELELFPQRDKLGQVLIWILGRFSHDPIYVVNAFAVLNYFVAAIVFYLVLRVLAIRRLYAALFSLCFAFTRFQYMFGIAHAPSFLLLPSRFWSLSQS